MLTIWKYKIPAEDYFVLSLPLDAKPLTVQTQYGQPQMWVLLDQQETIYVDRIFRVAGTGHPISEPIEALQHIDTFQLQNGKLVFHVFEMGPKARKAIDVVETAARGALGKAEAA